MKNIVLVDDHIIVRNGLRGLIEKLGPYKVSAEYDDGQALLDALPLQPVPDLAIIDLNMPGMNGDAVMERLNSLGVEWPVLILTLSEEENTIVRLFRLGVRGYLQKNCTAVVLRQALEEIFSRGFYHNELLTLALKTSNLPEKKSMREQLLERFSEREKEFMRLVCHEEEYTYDQIASHMKVHRRTVDGYRESVFDKFGIKSKTGLVLFALRNRLFGDN